VNLSLACGKAIEAVSESVETASQCLSEASFGLLDAELYGFIAWSNQGLGLPLIPPLVDNAM